MGECSFAPREEVRVRSIGVQTSMRHVGRVVGTQTEATPTSIQSMSEKGSQVGDDLHNPQSPMETDS